MSKSIVPFLLGIAVLSAPVTHAQASLDSSFTTPGFYTTQSPYMVSAATAQPDGKMIVAGDFVRYNNQPSTNLVRLQTDGRVDPSFDSMARTNGQVLQIVVQADGKIVLGGMFNTFKNQYINRNVIRLNANGTLDSSFTAPDYIRHGFVSIIRLASQPDGKVLIWGYGVKYNVWQNELVRLNQNGTLDTSFHCQAQLPQEEGIFSMAALPDGKLYIGGSFTTFSGKAKANVARLLPDGTVDDSFTAPAFACYSPQQIYITGLLPLPDGSLYTGGVFYYCGNVATAGVARLHSDGSVDPNFQVSSSIMPYGIAKVDTAGDKVVAGGLLTTYYGQFMLARYNSNGSLDGSFYNSIPDAHNNTSYNLMDFTVLPDGSINIGGGFSTTYSRKYYTGLAHFYTDGSIDTTLDVAFQQVGTVYKTKVLHDGKIMVGGNFNLYGTTPANNLVRLLPSGALDETFNTGTGPDDLVSDIAETTDSLLLISGNFKKVNGNNANGVARLLRNGSFDTQFATGTGPDNGNYIYTVHALPDGKVLVGGSFGQFNGAAKRGIVRLLQDGSVDAGFTLPTTPPWYSIGTIASLSNDQVLIGDNSYPGTFDYTRPLPVWRLNEDGSIDNTFQTQNVGGFSVASKLDINPQNKIFYSGKVLTPGGTPNSNFFTEKLYRLNESGSTDSSANAFPQKFYVSDFKILGDSGILACGHNLDWNDSASYIMRFKPDLSIDSTFNPIALFYDLKSLDCLTDGRIVAAGEPVRFFGADVESIPNIAILKSPSLKVVGDSVVVPNVTGTVEAGTAATDTMVTTQIKVYNTGSTTAELGTGSSDVVLVDGPDAAAFHVDAGQITSLRKNDSLTLIIQFRPSSIGIKTAHIVIPYNNGVRQRYSFTLMAQGSSVVTAVNDVPDATGTVVFPNPNSGSFYVKSALRQYSLYVYDVLGHLVLEKQKLPADQVVPVRLNQAKGLYWLKFTSGKQTVVRQMLLQ